MITPEDTFDDLEAAPGEYLAARPAAPAARPAAPAAPTANERVRAFDAQLQDKLRAGYQQVVTGLDGRGASLRSLVELSLGYHLPHISRFFLRFFHLPRAYPAAALETPVTYCETLEQFLAARLASYALSPALRASELGRLKAEAEAQAPGGGAYGVYLSGQGCYLNGWLFNYGRANSRPRDLLRATAPDMPRILSAALHELLGHGFLAEYSALGAEKKAAGVLDWEYARRFQFREVDSPAQTVWVRKLALAEHVSRVLEEGWASWVAALLTPALLGQPRQPRYTLTQIWEAVAGFPVSALWKTAFRGLLTDLFLEPAADPLDLLPAVRLLQNIALNWDFAAGLGQPPAYVVGSLLLDQLEARLGLLNVPYALLIAANVTYDLAHLGWNDLQSLFRQSARFNPDWRLAALSTLPAAPPNPSALATAARSQLNLAAPAAFGSPNS